MPPFAIDKFLSLLINQLAHKADYLDHFTYMLAENKLLKGGIVLAVFYLLWFLEKSYHVKLIIAMMAAFVAEIGTILLSLTLPFRARPYTGIDIPFDPPVKIDFWWNSNISSFPSDHATLFTVLGLGIFFCNKKIGWPIMSYVVVFILLPRMYLGLHYFTDLLAGALVGAITLLISYQLKHVKKLAAFVVQFAEQKPQYFYPLLFIVSYQLVDLFTETREVIGFLRHPLGVEEK